MIKFLFYLGVVALFVVGCAPKGRFGGGNFNSCEIKNSESMYKATMRPYKVKGVWYYPKPVEIGDVFIGKASWYGPNFHGELTSNGERYNMYARTAASKTLPINTWVKVTNLDNGLETVVRINDRGPFVRGRIIDLSYTAAQDINLIRNGVCNVKLEVVDYDKRANKYAVTASKKRKKFFLFSKNHKRSVRRNKNKYFIQIASLYNKQKAINLKSKYKKLSSKYRPYLVARGNRYKILIGRFKNKKEAKAFARSKNLNSSFIVRD